MPRQRPRPYVERQREILRLKRGHPDFAEPRMMMPCPKGFECDVKFHRNGYDFLRRRG